MRHQKLTDASGAHETYAVQIYGQTAYKLYYPGGLAVGSDASRWTYDSAGRLTSIPGVITSQTYEADGQTKKITYANGVSTEFTYDANRRWLVRIVTKSPSGAALINNLYGRDLSGRIVWISGLTPSESWDYGYDTLSRLTFVNNGGDDALDETFSYDIADNMLAPHPARRLRLSGRNRATAACAGHRSRAAPSAMTPMATCSPTG